MESRKCAALGRKFGLCFNRRENAADSIQIDKISLTGEDPRRFSLQARRKSRTKQVKNIRSFYMGTALKLAER